MHFSIDQIAHHFDTATFARGEDYVRRSKVISFEWDDGFLHGEVEGSGRTVYEQSIYLHEDRRGLQVEGDCTCPMDYNCKHVVAVLLASIGRQGAAPVVAPSDLPATAERWLERLALTVAQAGTVPAPTRGPEYRLAYVLMPDSGDGALRLNLCKARLRKDGSIASATIHNDFYSVLSMRPGYLRPDDEEPVRLLSALRTGSMYAGDTRPTGRIGTRLLEQLRAEGRLLCAESAAALKNGKVRPVRTGPPRHAALGWHGDGNGGQQVRLGWRFDDGTPVGHVLATEPAHYLHNDMLGELALPQEVATVPLADLLDLVARAPPLAPQQRAGMAARLAAQGLDRVLPPPLEMATRQRRDIVPVPCLLLDTLPTEIDGELAWDDYATLSFDYDGMSTVGVTAPVLRRMSGATIELVERDLEAERAAAGILAGLGFSTRPGGSALDDPPGAMRLPAPEDWIGFMRHGVPRLRAAGWQVASDAGMHFDIHDPQEWYAELDEEGEGVNAWFALELGFVIDGQRHALLPLLLQMIRDAPHDFAPAALAARPDGSEVLVSLLDGRRAALPWSRIRPILATLGELYFAERLGRTLRLPVADAARLAELERAAQLRWLGGERLRELGRKLDGFTGIVPVAAPAGLRATLRAYQHDGLAWMQFLREYDFAGILADDMGLGKTIQTLAHILAEKEAGRLDAPALVVAPTSLMGNWQAEAARFAPGLRVLLLHGKDRAALFDKIGQTDLVLTTYALLGRDEDALRQRRYHLLILDEAQYIKNSRSRTAQVARLLDARHRLCLTGTPVQNHLGELWSQFHFLLPGLLGDEKAFNAHFRKPIEQQGDALRKDLLARRVKPFMLRRTKDRVATELPPKTEIVLPVELGGAQRDLYETVRVAMDRKVRDEIDRKGLARSQIVILDALLKLRQACCDPRLLKGHATAGAGSAKLDTLMELLDTLLSEGRKVLVFSQFTSMLALIAEVLQARAVEFALLTGDTVDRAAPIAAFQEGDAGVFLISLKAGGVGLNLTAADTVIHYDPWWNPASENQATDRAWRIGQEKPVFVYKLIARGTVEEKIQEMQRRKGELANAVLDAEGGLAPALGVDELRAIFA
ncbi:DEAD/DEAH box helicase [Pseudoduganella umbonata]|uniref:Helicase n=1 Tax=Pseudoduganella umbonata TaxID=864828 RepID=A0A4P8HRW1_9BURK|nr:DEAD/DEAH box helicase [Pseudoduganella umbonata]MBB3222385.1 superfamily II DNA or RNA helicase [Pseudoduganella umbonata]QCP12599.1 helicase [Pseudoduganella umbonata]